MDAGFLTQPFDYVGTPLKPRRDVQRVLFAPGHGLGLGDQFLCLHLLERLRAHYSDALIYLWTDFDEFWNMFRNPRLRIVPSSQARPLELVGYIQSNTFDVVIAGYYPGCLRTFSFSARPTVFCAGTELGHFRAFFAENGVCREIPLVHLNRSVTEEQRFLGLFEDFGMRATFEPVPRVWRRPPRLHRSPRVLLHPGAGKAYKQWAGEKWRELAQLLLGSGIVVAVSSGTTPGEQALARAIQRGDTRLAVLAPMKLEAFLTQMSWYDLVVSADTFIQLAVAWGGGPDALTIYGPTSPLRFCPRTPKHFYVSPIEVDAATVAGAVVTWKALRQEGPAGVAQPGSVDELGGSSAALTEFAANPVAPLESPEQTALQWKALVERYRECLEPRHRRLLVGDDATVLQAGQLAGTVPWSAAAAHLRGTAVVRGAECIRLYQADACAVTV